MIKAINCAALSVALEKLKEIVAYNEQKGQKTVIFCEDRLSLAAERTVCAAVGGTFLTSVYTFARFLSAEKDSAVNVLSAQGSAMAIRKIIEDNRDKLTLFKKLSASAAAQSVYDTIALLYSSRISADDAKKAAEKGGVLGGKLHDLAIIYSGYEKYLKESGREDRNGYLKQLGGVIENSAQIKQSEVIFLGFQAFTCTATECARAAFASAKSVYGLFIGGREDIYVNEAGAAFIGAAADFGGAQISNADEVLDAEAEVLRKSLFNPESFYFEPTPTDKVRLFEAADGEEELEFIAASIKKHVLRDKERYAKISVMLPDLDGGERALSRVFSRYRIPYYADRRLPLSEHSVCTFIVNYLLCALSGCRFAETDGVISSPYFPASRRDKDEFRNYALKFCQYRGGIKKAPKEEALNELGFSFEAVERVRKTFLEGLEFLSTNSVKSSICGGLRLLLQHFKVQEKLKNLSESFRDDKPTAAEFSARAYEAVMNVLDEAESLFDKSLPLNEFIKILKSGFAAMKISLIPPKADAVFVGDLAATANTGSNVVFAARLTGDVPSASPDISLLTDREIAQLEAVNINISPKIRQVNARKREVCALNICAFRKRLYLSYPVRLGGEESGVSEIVAYAQAAFCTGQGKTIVPMTAADAEKTELAYYCSEKLPALGKLVKYSARAEASAIYAVLKNHGFAAEADAALKKRGKKAVTCGEKLYLNFNSLSPTALETYFSCPYMSFIKQGLKVQEREEGAVRAADTGNFVHSVLQDLAAEVNGIDSETALEARARELCAQKLAKPPYSALNDSKSGQYTAAELVEEAVKVSFGMYAQIKNSQFTVSGAEEKCEISLPTGVKIYGRIDRVDQSGEMVRVIDYKTGTIDAAATKYYTGAKLQLPLYLLSVSGGKRAVGAYYFPAAVEFRYKKDGVFRLQGFMDGGDDVVSASDKTVQPNCKSEYFDAYLGGRKLDCAMPREDFKDFLDYSGLVAGKGADEMISGNIAPSPAADVCKYCKAGGSCGFAAGVDGAERKSATVKCAEIAQIARNAKEGGNG